MINGSHFTTRLKRYIIGVVKRNPLFSHSISCKNNGFLFTTSNIIESNVNLTKIQKFYYLQSAVKGRAAQCFQSLSLSNENYDAAWRLLKARFENKKIIVHHHALFDLPIITKVSRTSLRKLIDDAATYLRVNKA